MIRPQPRSTLFPYTTLFRSAKISGTELGFRVADRCMQIHGGIGLAAEMPIAQMWRDARSFMITEGPVRSEEHTSELQSPDHLVCRLLLEKKNINNNRDDAHT